MLILKRRKISFDTTIVCEKIIMNCVIKTSLAINKDLYRKINGQFIIATIEFFNQEINLIFHENSVAF